MTTSFILGGAGDIIAQKIVDSGVLEAKNHIVESDHFQVNWARSFRMGVVNCYTT